MENLASSRNITAKSFRAPDGRVYKILGKKNLKKPAYFKTKWTMFADPRTDRIFGLEAKTGLLKTRRAR